MLRLAALALTGALFAGCAQRAPVPPAAPPTSSAPAARAPSPAPQPSPPSAPQLAPAPPRVALGPAPRARNWEEFQLIAARRMVEANPGRTYLGEVPATLLAIPVLEIELDADGNVRHIRVLRPPRQALDTVQLAMDAVRRGAPYGDISRLPRPWRFAEVFLFDDERRFKPRTLDQ